MDKDKRWFRIKYGYNTGEFVSVPEEYLAKAIYAKNMKNMFSYNDTMIDAKEIKTITPDYHKHTGWNAWYEPQDAEDFKQIQRDCPNYDSCVNQATELAVKAIQTRDMSLLSIPLSVKRLN